MFRGFYCKLVVVVLAYLFASSPSYAFNNTTIGKLPGAKINGAFGSCNPADGPNGASPCSGQNITRDNFKVNITFNPKMPDKDSAGNPWTGMDISVPGQAIIPKSYSTLDGNTGVFYLSPNCGGAANCYALTTVYDAANNPIPVNGTAFSYPGGVGSVVYETSGNVPVTTQKSPIRNPTSGPVTLITLDSNGNPVKLLDSNGNPVKNAYGYFEYVRSNVVYKATCTTTDNVTFTHVSSSSVFGSSTVGGVTTTTGPCPNGMVIHNLVAVGSYPVQNCTIGNTESYANNMPILSADCEIIRDLNQCPDKNNCNIAMVGGGIQYNTDGTPMLIGGMPVTAVADIATVKHIPGSLYYIVFSPFYTNADLKASFLTNINSINETIELDKSGYSVPLLGVNFELRYEGNQACVYAHGVEASKEWRVTMDYPTSLKGVYDLPNSAADVDPLHQPTVRMPNAENKVGNNGIIRDNCVPAPPPEVDNSLLVWNNMISPVCTNYDSSSSRFRWAGAGLGAGSSRAFLGVVVECIESTLIGIFYPSAGISVVSSNGTVTQGATTIFSAMQGRAQNAVRALMAMYLIFFGYKLMIGKEVPKRNEWMWLALKLVLVSYFALGSGMTQLLPNMLDASKSLSMIVMEAGIGTGTITQASADKNSDGSPKTAAFVTSELYPYCDFRDTTKFSYAQGKDYFKLWDMIDCKLAKYLGIGDNAGYPGAPQVLFVGIAASISLGLGVPILLFSLIFLSITIMIVVRVVHIYIMAFTGLLMLVFISPIVIPAVFFETTKPIFTQWFSQLMAFWLQPIILFGFLSFMFVLIDGVMFGGNHSFELPTTNNPAMRIVNSTGNPVTYDNYSCEGSDLQCRDKAAAAYQYQTIKFNTPVWPNEQFWLFHIWQVNSHDGAILLMTALGKLVLISFLAYLMIGSIEPMSARLVGAMGTGAAGYSAAPVVAPQQFMKNAVNAAGSAKDFAAKNIVNPFSKADRDRFSKTTRGAAGMLGMLDKSGRLSTSSVISGLGKAVGNYTLVRPAYYAAKYAAPKRAAKYAKGAAKYVAPKHTASLESAVSKADAAVGRAIKDPIATIKDAATAAYNAPNAVLHKLGYQTAAEKAQKVSRQATAAHKLMADGANAEGEALEKSLDESIEKIKRRDSTSSLSTNASDT